MPSPFPGMNPYFEQPDVWRGFHQRFLVYFQDALAPQLGAGYYSQLEDALFLDRAPTRFAVADAAVAADPPGPAGAAAGVTAPVTTTVPRPARRRHRRLVIRDRRSREVVTVIELLSPTNKTPGRGRGAFREKRAAILESAASYVELDLLRGGRRLPVRRLPACDYYVLVGRAWERPRVGLWPLHLRGELPAVPIPLRAGEVEPLVPLKPALDRAYDGGGFHTWLYESPPDPPLAPADAAWADALIPQEDR